MKIAVTAAGPTLESQLDPRFGRCQYFLFIETDDVAGGGDVRVECVANPHRASSGGTGIRCAQLLADRRVTTVLTGEVGPNARRALETTGITVVTGRTGSIAQAIAGLDEAQPAG